MPESIAASPRKRRVTLVAVIIASVLVATALAVFNPGGRFLGTQVVVATVKAAPLRQTVVASGRVLTLQRVSVAAEIAGRVEAIPFDEGEHVTRGAVLVRMDDADELASIELARASVAQAQARLRQIRETELPVAQEQLRQAQVSADQARRQYERDRDLRAQRFIGETEFDQARKSLDIATSQLTAARLQVQAAEETGSASALALAALDQARANLQIAQRRLEQNEIVSPADGVLLTRRIEVGDVVQPGVTVMELASDGEMQMVVRVDERHLSRIDVGQPATGSADAFATQQFDAQVSWISPAIDAERGSVDVRLRVVDPPTYLRQDMTVSAAIETARRKNAMAVPIPAVHGTDDNGAFVFLHRGGKVIRQPVRTGVRDNEQIEIVEGLAVGDEVIVSPTDGLSSGQRVTAVNVATRSAAT